VRRALACAAIDVLFRNQGGTINPQEVREIEAAVARKINAEVGALRSWRKALKARNRKDPQAYRIYEAALAECERQPNPRAAAHNLLASIQGL
jgi:hypothetical protein